MNDNERQPRSCTRSKAASSATRWTRPSRCCVERQVKHALYGKYIRRSTKLHAHDADNACNEGDVVRIAECAPMSKTKNWRVVEILARAAE